MTDIVRKYKVGDYVRLVGPARTPGGGRERVAYDPGWVPDLERLGCVGKVYQVSEVGSDVYTAAYHYNCYELRGVPDARKTDGRSWAYEESWLEPAGDFRPGDRVRVLEGATDEGCGRYVGQVHEVESQACDQDGRYWLRGVEGGEGAGRFWYFSRANLRHVGADTPTYAEDQQKCREAVARLDATIRDRVLGSIEDRSIDERKDEATVDNWDEDEDPKTVNTNELVRMVVQDIMGDAEDRDERNQAERRDLVTTLSATTERLVRECRADYAALAGQKDDRIDQLHARLATSAATNQKLQRKFEAVQRDLDGKGAVIGKLFTRARTAENELALKAQLVNILTVERDEYKRLYQEKRGPVLRIGQAASATACAVGGAVRTVARQPGRALAAVGRFARRQVAGTRWRAAAFTGLAMGLSFGTPMACYRAYPALAEAYQVRREAPPAANPADPRERAWIAARAARPGTAEPWTSTSSSGSAWRCTRWAGPCWR